MIGKLQTTFRSLMWGFT